MTLYKNGHWEHAADEHKNARILYKKPGYMNRLYVFNHTCPTEPDKREVLLKELFAEIEDGCFIEPPLHANRGGHHVHMDKNIYATFYLTKEKIKSILISS